MNICRFITFALIFFALQINAQRHFGEPQIITNAVIDARGVFASDIDGDGDDDILSASSTDNKIAWYENLGAENGFGTQIIISDSISEAKTLFACDIDGDKDIDVLSASFNDSSIVWFENIDGNGTFSVEKNISNDAKGVRSVYACDIDGDGDNDVLSAIFYDHKICWYENDGNGNFGRENIISIDAWGATYIHADDFDGDNDLDVIYTSDQSCASKIIWFKNLDGNGTFEEQQSISEVLCLNSVYTGDLDDDGDVDVVAANFQSDKIAWFENDGMGAFDTSRIIGYSDVTSSIYICDFDQNGNNDIVRADESTNTITWYKNNGDRTFEEIIVNSWADDVASVFACDIDGDNDLDILSAQKKSINWHKNIYGEWIIGNNNLITNEIANPTLTNTTDIDNDEDNDVVVVSSDKNNICWFENDGNGLFGTENIISIDSGLINSIHINDLNNDQNQDIIAAFTDEDIVAWFNNNNGTGEFTERNVVTDTIENPIFIYTDDMDNDNDEDIIVMNSSIILIENNNNQFSNAEIIVEDQNAKVLVLSDVDKDGDMDLIAGNDNISWYENTSSKSGFVAHNIGWENNINSLAVADLDGDDDADIIFSAYSTQMIAWYENTDGEGNFSQKHIVTIANEPTHSVYADDMDDDGDIDIICSTEKNTLFYENEDGLGNFDLKYSFSTPNVSLNVIAAHINGDDQIDILVATDSIVSWYENLPNPLILEQPKDFVSCTDTSASFQVTSLYTYTYQWMVLSNDEWIELIDNDVFQGAKSSELLIPQTDSSLHGQSYKCILSNSYTNVESDTVQLKSIDQTAPIPTISELEIIYGECSVEIIEIPTANDNCSGSITAYTNNELIFNEVGEFVVEWIYEDENGNISLQEQLVFVIDTINPVPVSESLPILEAECSLEITSIPEADDNCSGTIQGTTQDSFFYNEQGSFTINWQFDDENENIVVQSQEVIIQDITNPIISCIHDTTVYIPVDSTNYEILGIYFDPIDVSDNCINTSYTNSYNYDVSLNNVVLPIGTHKITWSVKDIANNMDSCSHNIKVESTVGMNQIIKDNLIVFPNPVEDKLNIEFSNIQLRNVTIIDFTGKIIYKTESSQPYLTVDFRNFEKGIYLLTAKSNKQRVSKKVIYK